MSEMPWWRIEIDFAAKDEAKAERMAEAALDAICGGEIGMGLHVCKRHDWVMGGPIRVEDE